VSSRLSLILRGSSFRVLQTLISIAIGVIMMPFLIATLGQEMYGLWIVIGSVVGAYYLLDLGFNQAVTRYVSQYIHQNNPQAANKIINTALVIYSLLGGIVFIASVLAAQFGAAGLMDNAKNLTLAQTILIITGLSLALEFPAKAFPGIISAYMRYDFIALVKLGKNIIDALLIYYFLSNGYGLVAMALITLCTGLISTAIFIKFTTSIFKELEFKRSAIDLSTFKDVFHFSKWVFVTDINSMLRDKIDIWFIAFYVGNSALTVYYVAVRLVEYALQFLTQATGITGPIFTEYYAKGEIEKLEKSVRIFIKLDIALGSLILVGFYLLGVSFIDVWMKGSISAQNAFACLMILAIGRFAVYFASPLNSLLMTLNKHHIVSWISIAETLVCALLCWWLIPSLGVLGAAYAIAIPNLVGRLIAMPLFAAKYINLGWLNLVLRIVLFSCVSAVLSYFISYLAPELKNLNFLKIALFSPLIIFMQLIICVILCSKEDFLSIKNIAQRKMRVIEK
jgi:O-antigen/teichoic acid export membrane protein